MTFETLYTKYMWVRGITTEQAVVKKKLEHEYCGELLFANTTQ